MATRKKTKLSKGTKKVKESDESYTIKNEGKTPVLKPKVGKLEIEDYEWLVALVDEKMKQYKQFSAAWSKWATVKQKLEKKISQLEKAAVNKTLGPAKLNKQKVRWFCFTCQKEHDKVERKLQCPDCKGTDIVTMDEYLAQKQEKEVGISA